MSLSDVSLLAIVKQEEDFIAYLEDYFTELDRELLHTMRCYQLNNCSGIKTAENLFIHRNTWNYRLNKFHNLTKLNLHDYDDAAFFRFWLSWQNIK